MNEDLFTGVVIGLGIAAILYMIDHELDHWKGGQDMISVHPKKYPKWPLFVFALVIAILRFVWDFFVKGA